MPYKGNHWILARPAAIVYGDASDLVLLDDHTLIASEGSRWRDSVFSTNSPHRPSIRDYLNDMVLDTMRADTMD